jgi:hypothetical protein
MAAGRKESLNHVLYDGSIPSVAHVTEVAPPSGLLRSYPDIFIPQCRLAPDELLHQPDAFLTLNNLDGNAPTPEKLLLPHETPVLADDHAGNSIQDMAPEHMEHGESVV